MPLLQLCEDLFNLQLELGGDALAENPLNSCSFKKKPIQGVCWCWAWLSLWCETC